MLFDNGPVERFGYDLAIDQNTVSSEPIAQVCVLIAASQISPNTTTSNSL